MGNKGRPDAFLIGGVLAQAVEAAQQVDREWGGGTVTLDLEVGPLQVNLQDERTLGWFLLAFPKGHLLGRRLDGPGLDTLSLDVDKVCFSKQRNLELGCVRGAVC